MLTSTITTRCRQLAIDSRTEYLAEHSGKTPDAEGGSRPEIQGYFTADWRTLRREGAQEGDKAACRGVWEESFFQLVPAGGNEGGT